MVWVVRTGRIVCSWCAGQGAALRRGVSALRGPNLGFYSPVWASVTRHGS